MPREIDERLLTNQDTMPGFAPQYEIAVEPPRICAPLVEHRLAQRIVGPRFIAKRLVVIETGHGSTTVSM